jgi:DNA polymerase
MTLESLASQIIICTKCPLFQSRKNAVPGEGNHKADVLFIGEAPGNIEDMQGKPFVGKAGKFLDEMLSSVGLTRGEVFITNVVKCHPERNRQPRTEEIIICTQNYLFNQICLIKPKLTVLMGRTPTKVFFPGIKKLSNIHGQFIKKNESLFLVLYHPALAIHRQDLKQVLLKDFQILKEFLEK